MRAAIKNLFVDTNLLESSFIDDYDMAKDLRENADYKSDFSKEGAEQLIAKAEKFLDKVKTLLDV
ncbi:MAG: HEPN domain-containing protein [Candidatus Omnitrophica bacterium]|nr:HEPN domain-containing protein [Candidatus Omnitrophota bacterium]